MAETLISSAERRFPDGAVIDVENCLICQLDDVDEEAVIFRGELWACEVTPGFEVPGWFVLRIRRHALGWADLNNEELASFGPYAQRLVQAVGTVFDAPATYLLNFGEAFPHFHVLIAARGGDVPTGKRLAGSMSLRQQRLDRSTALGFVPAVRAAYRAAVGSWLHGIAPEGSSSGQGRLPLRWTSDSKGGR